MENKLFVGDENREKLNRVKRCRLRFCFKNLIPTFTFMFALSQKNVGKRALQLL